MQRFLAAVLTLSGVLAVSGARAVDPITIKISDHYPVNHVIPAEMCSRLGMKR
jgi:hypothetical protein